MLTKRWYLRRKRFDVWLDEMSLVVVVYVNILRWLMKWVTFMLLLLLSFLNQWYVYCDGFVASSLTLCRRCCFGANVITFLF